MTTENTKITETTDNDPKSGQDTPEPVRPRQSSLDKATDAEAEGAGASDEVDDDFLDAPADNPPAGGFAAGAAAVVSAGLGVSSVTGTALSDMLRSRQELIGQIKASTGGGVDQISLLYSSPWHTGALVNGIFALAAVVIGGVLLAVHAGQADTRPWVKAVALGGAALGGIGLLVAGGIYFDLFASAPQLPTPRG